MKNNFYIAIKLTLVSLFFFSGVYTLILLGIAQLAPNNGKGEITQKNDRYYYTNTGQNFTDDKYFTTRPSAVSYNASGSGGSNKGPSNPEYLSTVKARIDSFCVHNPDCKKEEIPAELLTASGSGLDPDISVEAARIQVPRIAKIRHLSKEELYSLIEKSKTKPLFGFLGPEKVNVLKLNLALNN